MLASLREGLRRGDPAIWFAGTGLGICVVMIAAMVGLILWNGLGFFWPKPIVELTLADGSKAMGEVSAREAIPTPGNPAAPKLHRLQLKLGNRDISGSDFVWIDDAQVKAQELPRDAVYVERSAYGPFIGRVVKITEGDKEVASGSDAVLAALPPLLSKAEDDRAELRALERGQIGAVNYAIEQTRLRGLALDLVKRQQPAVDQTQERKAIEDELTALKAEYTSLEQKLAQTTEETSRAKLTLRTATGEEKELPIIEVYRLYPANQLGTMARAGIYAGRLWEFLSGDPRESNTEGGIFPAIFGTVMMVMIMSVVAVPFGVLAALYLREYAKQGVLVRLVRIAVNNLAGVPSIVFGVFGLGFFVYLVGGSIDQWFYPERLPTPTFGTGGILWASLTLGLLTVPVVIVASEEALSAVPRSMREASLATGATKFQTICRVVLPAAAPGILTGLILAMARGAGEVAPLMITGVVKLAPDLPLDGLWPYLHLDRKFMHLGFHIYDVGFQSPNVEAAKPMVYATAVLLLLIVVMLNLTAIIVRNRLRKKYRTSAFS
jgi:phosphate transport system permease protein